MKLYTKSGDDGTTGLLFGGRTSKAGPRTEAYGAVDTAISAMGMARAFSSDDAVGQPPPDRVGITQIVGLEDVRGGAGPVQL